MSSRVPPRSAQPSLRRPRASRTLARVTRAWPHSRSSPASSHSVMARSHHGQGLLGPSRPEERPRPRLGEARGVGARRKSLGLGDEGLQEVDRRPDLGGREVDAAERSARPDHGRPVAGPLQAHDRLTQDRHAVRRAARVDEGLAGANERRGRLGVARRDLGHGTQVDDTLLEGPHVDRPVGGRAERQSRLGARRLALGAVRCRAVGRQVLLGERARVLLAEALEVARGCQVPDPAIAPGQGRVRDVTEERLDEAEAAAVRRARVRLQREDLAAHEAAHARLQRGRVLAAHRGERGDREAPGEHRGVLHERPVGRFEAVEAGPDEGQQGLGRPQVGEVAGRPEDAVGLDQRPVGEEHPDDLDRVERDARRRAPGSLRTATSGRPGTRPSSRARIAWSLSGSRRTAVAFGRSVPHPGRRSRSSGRASVTTRSGLCRLQSSRWSMKSRRPSSPQWRSSKTSIVVPRSAMRSNRVRHAANSSSRPPGGRLADAEQREQAGFDARPFDGVGKPLGAGVRDPPPGDGRVVVVAQPRPPADHLGQRPERAPGTVGGGPAGVPVDALDDAVEVLLQLPGKSRLADPRLADDREEPRPPVATGGMEAVLEQPQLVVAADEGRLDDVVGPAATLADDAHGAEGRDRRRLALQDVVPGRLEEDGRPDGPPGGLPDEDGPGRRHRLQPGRGVDEVARHHALALGAEGDRRLAGQHAGPQLELESGGRIREGADGVDQLEGGPDGALGIVLVRGRRAPDGHHGVPDELLHGAAVARDDVARGVEVAAEELARRLRVAVRGERREADEVGEEDADEPALGRGAARPGVRSSPRPAAGPAAMPVPGAPAVPGRAARVDPAAAGFRRTWPRPRSRRRSWGTRPPAAAAFEAEPSAAGVRGAAGGADHGMLRGVVR